MNLETILYEKSDAVATIKLNRPHVLNAASRKLWLDFRRALREAAKDTEVKAIIITGEGRAFSAGADLKESQSRTLDEYRDYLVEGQEISRELYRMEKPTIAAVNGYALGSGCEIAVCCDIRIAAESAKFGFPEARVASGVGSGVLQLLPLLLGMGKAKELIFTAEYIDGDEAARIGLVNMVVPDDQLMHKAQEIAAKMAANSALSISLMKAILNRAHEASMEAIMDWEVEMMMSAIQTQERVKALEDFTARKR
ncbi:MAG: enoyl-CoA hydratase/isomerase family protein [Deltaproteobacteria bacterium]|nr:enoyl-CoA hydratase/isomerase family protein [Deltaproteobacteria bacterium]MBW2306683.1 enoyl-CoA hydratase/isomerase family protein [Deltaproteobacteria bacterium]